MNENTSILYHEEESLLIVRQWKEQIYQETKDLTPSEHIEKLREIVNDLKVKYNLQLPSLHLASHG